MTRLNTTDSESANQHHDDKPHAAHEAVNLLHEAHTLGVFSSLFSECSLTADVFRTLRELG